VVAIDRERILKAANAALLLEPVTITRFPARLSEGGLNGFYSNGDYWWPDPAKPDGLPYVQRDGESNPNNFAQHRLAVRDLRDAVAALGAAYKITGDDRYVAKAVAFLRVFFLDPKTRMNPHLKYASRRSCPLPRTAEARNGAGTVCVLRDKMEITGTSRPRPGISRFLKQP
jgi:hypothetical protein